MKKRKILTLSSIVAIAVAIIIVYAAINGNFTQQTEISTVSDIIGESDYASLETFDEEDSDEISTISSDEVSIISLEDIPEWNGESAYVVINNNVPFFTEDEITDEAFESYGDLDSLGRCTVAFACVGTEIMPTEDRGDISSIYPTGWVQAQYDSVDGGYLYNRCHLIAYMLTGENANEKNLITGTRYMNVEGMLPFETEIQEYCMYTAGQPHVMYRVTPIFDGDNLVASGVLLEAYSVEDSGERLQFCVYVYNVQPGIYIDYATGESYEE